MSIQRQLIPMFVFLLIASAIACGAESPPKSTPDAKPLTDSYGDPLPSGATLRLGTIRWRHEGSVNAITFSVDGKTIISAAGSGLHFWDRASGTKSKTLDAGPKAYGHMVLSHDCKTFAMALGEDVIGLWDVPSGKALPPINVKKQQGVLALSSDGGLIVWQQSDNSLCVQEVRTGKKLHEIRWRVAGFYTAVFSPDNKTLACGGPTPDVLLFDLTTGKDRHLIEANEVSGISALAFSPDGKTLASPAKDGGVVLWESHSGKRQATVRTKNWRFIEGAIALSPDGKIVALGGFERIVVWDVATRKELWATRDPAGIIQALAFSSDGKTMISGGTDHTIRVWNVADGKSITPSVGHQHVVSDIVFAPDGCTLASCSDDKTVRLWNLVKGKEERQFVGHKGGVHELLFGRDGRTLISASHDETIRWWETATGKEIRIHNSESTYFHIALSADGKKFAQSAYPREIRLFDEATLKSIPFKGGHRNGVGGLLFATADRILVSTAYWVEGKIQLWNMNTGEPWHILEEATTNSRLEAPPPKMAISADRRMLASEGQGGQIHLWELNTAKKRQSIQFAAKGITALALSPDGKLLAVSEYEGPIRFWDLTTEKEVGHFDAGFVQRLTFSPDSQLLATSGRDTTILIWPVTFAGAKVTEASREACDKLWTDVANADAAKAYRALRDLSAQPGHALSILETALKPVPAPEAGTIEKLILELDSDRFEVRKAANRELETLGKVAEIALRKQLKSPASLEQQQSIEKLLEKLNSDNLELSPDQLRDLRAIELLELIGTPEASKILERLATGASNALVAIEAQASLKRLAKLQK